MNTYNCPVCRSELSKEHYDRALGIVDAQRKAIETERLQIDKDRERLKDRIAEAKALAERKALERTQRLVQGKENVIQNLKETLRQLRQGTTPQTEGLEFEDNLTNRLGKEFPSDVVEHKGKSGDILHAVFDGKDQCGLIVYELKRTKLIQKGHVQQAAEARQSRRADIAILVTTGSRRGFNGFSTSEGVPIVAPQGVIALVTIIREHIIQMHRANVCRQQRQIIGKRVIEFLMGAHFRNHMEGIVRMAMELQEMLKNEAKTHMRIWQERWCHYQSISWDSAQIRSNLALVLQGKDPVRLAQPKLQPLVLLENQ
jgi:hypothetical protein